MLFACPYSAVAAPALFSPVTLARTDALMAQMTMAEKLGQLNQLAMFKPSAITEALVSQGRIGSRLSITEPADINRMQKLAVENTRLHIPLIFGYDVIHGHRTIFPVPLALAAAWDPALAEHQPGVRPRLFATNCAQFVANNRGLTPE